MRLREADHIVPLIAGGENRESNLRTLLAAHHKTKTAADVAERKRLNRLGLARDHRSGVAVLTRPSRSGAPAGRSRNGRDLTDGLRTQTTV